MNENWVKIDENTAVDTSRKNPPPPLCVYCSAPWTDDMLTVWSEAEMENGYYGDTWVDHIDTVIDVTCGSCGKLVYRKEVRT